MELGVIGLGRMGANIVERLLRGGHRIVAFDRDEEAIQRACRSGAAGAHSIPALVEQLQRPRAVWMMLPAGDTVEQTADALSGLLEPDDVVVDGGNSHYQDSMRRARHLEGQNLHFLDVGTSGGVRGLDEGYCLMIGGDRTVVERLRPIFETLAPSADRGWAHVGSSGAGHFVKMVHNGIEYGAMQAYAEGFAVLHRKQEFAFNLHHIAEAWRHGSVIRSWLLDLAAEALEENPDLYGIQPYVSDSGEGRWMVAESIAADVPTPVITLALIERLRSRERDSFSDKLLAVMRKKFGGHEVKTDS